MQIVSCEEDKILGDVSGSAENRRMFARQYPPVPRDNAPYSQAKRAEYDGDIDQALSLYLRAIKVDDRRDSSIKDYAGLLHMLGRTQEAVDFLLEHRNLVRASHGYNNLIDQMQTSILNFEQTRSLPRTLIVQFDECEGVTRASLPRIIPNPAKVVKITPFNEDSTKAIVEFATHSAARKALNVTKAATVKCAWAPAVCQATDSASGTIRDDFEWDLLMASPESQKRRLDTQRPSPLIDISPTQIDWCLDTPSPVRVFSSFF